MKPLNRDLSWINVDELDFDPDNPRLPERMRGKEEPDVIDYMLKFGNIIELMQSIAEMGYSSSEPLLVVKSDKGYIVVEGNRRLASLKLLRNPEIARVKKGTVNEIVSNMQREVSLIPCIEYSDRQEILDYLGYRHITGVKEWGSLEKARYLDQLYQIHVGSGSEEPIYKRLAKMIGSRADYVKKLHLALRLYSIAEDEGVFDNRSEEGDVNFSWLTTAVGYRSVIDYLEIELSEYDESMQINENQRKRIKQLFTWLYDPTKGVIKEVRNISKLAKIIENEGALKQLEKGEGIEFALLFTDEPENAFMRLINNAQDALERAKNSIEQLRGMPDNAIEKTSNIEKMARSIQGALKENYE